MSGMPPKFHYPLLSSDIPNIDQTTNAVSMRLFSDKQVQRSLNPSLSSSSYSSTYSYQTLLDTIYTSNSTRSTHPDSTDETSRIRFWNEFREVIAVQKLRENGELSKNIFPVLDTVFDEMDTLQDSAMYVLDDFPTHFPTELFKSWISSSGGVKLDSEIFGQCTHVGQEFVNGFVAIGKIIGWAVSIVSPVAFASKWYDGRCRPEEVAWKISNSTRSNTASSNSTTLPFEVPGDIRMLISEMNLTDASDFTGYKQTKGSSNSPFGSGGSPMHPSHPAMHSAASSASTWMAIVANLDDDQLYQARLLDFSISYYRTVAGVHYESDNRAGLALGQAIMYNQLPVYLAEEYGCDDRSREVIKNRVQEKISRIRDHDWSTWLPNGWRDPIDVAKEKNLM